MKLKSIILSIFLTLSFGTFANENIISAQGLGTVDLSIIKNKVQAKMMAKRAAQVDAQRQLTEIVRGLKLTSGTTVKDAELTSDVIATRVKGLLRGAFIIKSEIAEEGGSYVAEIELGICVNNEPPECKGKPTLKDIDLTK